MTDTRAEFESLCWTLLAPITIVVFVAIVLLLAFTVVRGRRGGREGRSGAPRLELAYAALLAVAVAVILGFSFGASRASIQ